MSATISINLKQKEELKNAFSSNRASNEQRLVVKLLLQNVTASDSEGYEQLRASFVENPDMELNGNKAEQLAAIIQTRVIAQQEGGVSWWSRMFGGYSNSSSTEAASSNGIGSAFGVQAVRVLTEAITPLANRLIGVIERVEPQVTKAAESLQGDLQPRIDGLLKHVQQRINGNSRIPPERWNQTIDEAEALLNFVEFGAQSVELDEQLEHLNSYKKRVEGFVKELGAEAFEQDSRFTYENGESDALLGLARMLRSLHLQNFQGNSVKTDNQEMTASVLFLRSDTPSSSTPKPSAQRSKAEAAAAAAAEEPSEVLVLQEGIKALKAIKERYLSISSKVQHAIDQKPSIEVLELKEALEFLHVRLNHLSERRVLMGDDAQKIVALQEKIKLVLQKAGLEEELTAPIKALRDELYLGFSRGSSSNSFLGLHSSGVFYSDSSDDEDDDGDCFKDALSTPQPGAAADLPPRQAAGLASGSPESRLSVLGGDPNYWTITRKASGELDYVKFNLQQGEENHTHLMSLLQDALKASENIIEHESGYRYRAATQLKSIVTASQSYVYDTCIRKHSDKKLSEALRALNILQALKPSSAYLSSEDALHIQEGKASAALILEQNGISSLLPKAGAGEVERFKAVLRAIKNVQIGHSFYRVPGLSSPYVMGFSESLIAQSTDGDKSSDKGLFISALQQKGETVSGALQREFKDFTKDVKKEAGAFIDLLLWKLVKFSAVIGALIITGYIGLDFLTFALRRRYYDLFLRALPGPALS